MLFIPAGSVTRLGAQFARMAEPLSATYDAASSATKYRTVIQNPRHFVLTYQWSGPTCGDWTPQEERTGHKSTLEAVMTWTHAEPCRSGDEPVVLTVRGWPDLAVLTCVYSGTDTGQGPECKQGL